MGEKNGKTHLSAGVDSITKVYYAYSPEYMKYCNLFEKEKNRASSVHNLVHAYKLFDNLRIYKPRKATRCELLQFHSKEYVDYVQKASTVSDIDTEAMENEGVDFGFGFDCPVERGLFDYIQLVAGSTIDAARALVMGSCRVAINWGGGWHHAKQDKAAGFCYVNDCVLGVLKLREHYQRILYIDIDVHHGDGVEDSFCATDKVMTLSFHHADPGYFPGSGMDVRGSECGKGKYHSLNVPLKEGLVDSQFIDVFDRSPEF